jgi:hypothetical protein
VPDENALIVQPSLPVSAERSAGGRVTVGAARGRSSTPQPSGWRFCACSGSVLDQLAAREIDSALLAMSIAVSRR